MNPHVTVTAMALFRHGECHGTSALQFSSIRALVLYVINTNCVLLLHVVLCSSAFLATFRLSFTML